MSKQQAVGEFRDKRDHFMTFYDLHCTLKERNDYYFNKDSDKTDFTQSIHHTEFDTGR